MKTEKGIADKKNNKIIGKRASSRLLRLFLNVRETVGMSLTC